MTKKTFNDAISAVLSGADPDQVADEVLAKTAAPVEDTTPAKKVTIGSTVETLLMDVELSYTQIVNLIHAQFENASTSARSVASIARAIA